MKSAARARWWLLDYLYAIRRQLASAFRPRTPAAYSAGDPALPAIVLLPGVYERWLFLEPAAKRLNKLGHRVFAVPELGLNGGAVPASATVVGQALSGLRRSHGVERCILLAHSKGGLIGKAMMLDAGAREGAGIQVLGLVAVATPFAGSSYARYLPPRSLRAFSPDDAVLASLQANIGINSQVVSIYPEFDPHIPGGSALPGAVNVRLPVAGHFRILADPAVLAAVEHAVARLSS